jgi:hypothetical protein
VQLGAEGDAYVMRWTNAAIFYAISSSREVVPQFTMEPGDPRYVANHQCNSIKKRLATRKRRQNSCLTPPSSQERRPAT